MPTLRTYPAHALRALAATLLLCLWCAASVARAQGTVLVADGRADLPGASTTDAEELLVKRQSLPKARRHWGGSRACEEGFEVIGGASGSFTKRGAQQRAVLYRYCVTGHDFANNGIAFVEAGRVVADILYEGGEDSSIEALADIDGDGLAEMVLGDGSIHQGYTAVVAMPIQFTPTGVKKFGIADVYDDDCGVGERCTMTAYRVTAAPGPAPVFYRETFRMRRKRWVPVGKAVKYSLRENEGSYVILK
jgi:hypothetical protein